MILLRDLAKQHEVQFGTSGVRGLVAQMSDELCYAYAQAFLNAIATSSTQVLVGHDLRPSSPRIAAACIQTILDSGRKALFCGALPTPALAHHCALHKTPGIIITGSHIPFDRNGIKFYRADGEIDKCDEQAIMDTEVRIPANLAPSPLPPTNTTALDSYIARYTEFFGARALAGKRIALYEHSSVARDVLRSILEKMGAHVLSLGRTDTFVPIDTEAVRQEDIDQAQAWAKQHRFDALLSTDGDADRPLIGDEHGNWLRGDLVGVLCSHYLRAETVVTPVSSNTAVEKSGFFKHIIRTRIGSPYVIAGMQSAHRGSRTVGYEANGGFLLGSDIPRQASILTALPTRDAVLPMLALLTMSSEKACPLSALARELPSRFTSSNRIQNIPTEASKDLIEKLSQDALLAASIMAPDSGPVVSQDSTDGLRLSFASGDIVHLRPSGNAPELRCYAEASSDSRAKELCLSCLARIAEQLVKG